jgi:threonine dehydratase
MDRPVTREEIDAAWRRVRGHVRRTPVIEVEGDAFTTPGPIILKLDQLQPTGSFKVRGATSLLTGVEVPAAGVVAASGGNFGLAIAWAAARVGVPATIFVPATSPAAKLEGLRATGADVRAVVGYYADALAAADAFIETHGALRAHAYDQREVVAGQGTVAVELEEQADVDTIMVACGGGGLLAGVAGWLGDHVRVVAVETEGTPTLARALAAGRPVDVEVGGIAASSLGARRLGSLAWAVRERVASLLVSDAAVTDAQRRLWQQVRLVAEPGGAAALAALTSGAYRPEPGERIAVLVCGANTDPGEVA